LKFDIVTKLAEYVALRDEIDANLVDLMDSFFYSPSWLIPFQKVLGDDREIVHIVGRNGDGTLNGSIHLSLVRTPFLKIFHPKVLAFLGTRSVVSPEHLDFAIKREARDEWFEFLSKYMKEELCRCAFAVFDSIAENAENFNAAMKFLEHRGFRVTREIQDVCPYLDLPDSFDMLLKGFSSNMRKIIRRTMKRSDSRVRLVDHTELGGIDDVLLEARRLHNLSRERKGDLGSFEREGYLEFHRELAQTLGKRESLYAKFLMTDRQAIAFRYGFIVDDVYYDYQTGYDPAFSDWRPGFIVLAKVVEDLITRGVKRFDFLRGDESYKRHWAQKDHKTYRYYVFSSGLKANIYSTIWRTYHGLKRTNR
jgi:hypothetical protein